MKMKKINILQTNETINVLCFLGGAMFSGLSVSCLRLISWTFQNWGNLKADELVYTLTANLSGTNPAMIKSGLIYCVPPGAIVAIVMLLLYFFFLKKNSLLQKQVIVTTSIVSLLAITGGVTYFSCKIELVDYIKNQNLYSTFVDDNYVSPDSVQITFPEKKRNLIYLYVESMEVSFSDMEHGGGKTKNLIPELTNLALEAGTFSGNAGIINGGYALYGSTYTMGGLFAQTTGLPLTTSHTQIQLSESFMPGVVALGDILEDAGYENVFCIGTDAAFADRDKYFAEHGNYTILDYNYSVANTEIPSDYTRDFWGYDDYRLYENAKVHLLELAQSDQPFNFTMLTVDSHAEDGYFCDLCTDNYNDKYSNVIACSSAQAADFVRWIQQQDFYENTTIVLAGDHCSMDSDFADDIPTDYERRIYTVFINPAPGLSPLMQTFRQYSSMDNFPTTLAALGAEIEGNRLGLGANLFSEEKTLVELYDISSLNTSLAQKSALLEHALGRKKEALPLELSYDDSKGHIYLNMKDEIEYTGLYDRLKCIVTHKTTGISHSFDLQKEDNQYTADIDLQNFLYKPGEYSFDVYLVLPDTLLKWCSSGSIDIETISFIPPAEFLLNQDGTSLGVVYRCENSNYSNIWFAIWSPENGQDDLVWYSANKKDMNWLKKIDLAMHTKEGNLAVHIYGGTNNPKDYLFGVSLPLNQLSRCDDEQLKSLFD